MKRTDLARNATLAVVNNWIRCAVYARYSSENQRETSIEDQIRNCRETASRKGWVILDDHIYIDSERTGTTVYGRDGLARIMEAAMSQPKPFDRILVDDTSRFGRNTADSLKNADILTFERVYLYFVHDGLDSAEPWFNKVFVQKAQSDQEFSEAHSHRVRRGKRGRFLNGYHPGNICFGYKNVAEEDPTRRGEYGRPAVIGVRQEILPEEARIVVRIFKSYAAGMSLREIACALNSEGIPTALGSRTGRKAYWCKSAIAEILRNRRYLGETTWGRTYQERDPRTGKLVTRHVPESEWDRKDLPELRIISDDLFECVRERFKLATRGNEVQRLGGMSRTEACRKYLFSGLLRCGVCGGNMRITTTNPARYGCARHRESNTCPNKVTILLRELEGQFIAALGENLQSEEFHEELVHHLRARLKTARTSASARQVEAERNRSEAEAERKALDVKINHVLAAIKEAGHSKALLAELHELESKAERLDEILSARVASPSTEITEQEVRDFVRNSVHRFVEILAGAPEFVRGELQKRMTSVTLTPTIDEHGPVYAVTGDVELFTRPEGVLQTNQLELVGLHYTIPISLTIQSYKNRRTRYEGSAGALSEWDSILEDPSAIAPDLSELETIALLREASMMDVDASLDEEIKNLTSDDFHNIKKWDGKDAYVYLQGLGGLRLAAMAA